MEFMSNYSVFSEMYANIFSFLVALCVISIFDKYVQQFKKDASHLNIINFRADIDGSRFDLARLDVDHLREIYMDHAKTALAVLLYLVTFGLHQASSKVDDQLALMHYYGINETWSNVRNTSDLTSSGKIRIKDLFICATIFQSTAQESFLAELDGWQKVIISKDLLAVLAWLFVALGTRDNMLLTHLESMVQYASNAESPR